MLDTRHLDKSIPVNDLIAAQDHQFVKGRPVYDVNNPHPGFGKDPNILNEYGHTAYPKYVYPEGNKDGVVVNNAKEEAEVMGDTEASDETWG